MTRRTLQLAAVWLASMAACDGSELLSGSGTIPRGQLLEQFAAIICDHLAPCCQADGLAYDSASCRQTAEVGFAAQYTFVSSSYASYDGQAARRCLSAFAAAMPACGAKDVGWGGGEIVDRLGSERDLHRPRIRSTRALAASRLIPLPARTDSIAAWIPASSSSVSSGTASTGSRT
jgi:hypothetical protein